MYFISPTQINVLTPLDSTTGSVQVVVNNNGALRTQFYDRRFGLPSTALTAESAAQSGSLPSMPCKVGGNPATVGFAGLISPGLYQFNTTIPSTAANGDNSIICTYGGLSTPTGDPITVQK